MSLFSLLSRVLSYPTEELQQHLPELISYVQADRILLPEVRQELQDLLDSFAAQDLLDLQSRYVSLFDRGRAVSLLMFEHVHGESRDRGQAMVDLIQLYENYGLSLSVRELPDHIPLFLEFLGQLPFSEAQPLLEEVAPIFGVLAARLQQRSSPYHAAFGALLCLAGKPVDMETLRAKAAQEIPDDTLEAIDKIWEEESVRFAGNPQACAHNEVTQPVHWASKASPLNAPHA